MSYLSHSNYGAALGMLAALKKDGESFCWPFTVATTAERKPVHGLRIHRRRRNERPPRGVLIVGGAHAREMIPPESVLLFAWDVCKSYVNGNDLSFGGKTYPALVARLLVEVLDLFVVPLLNPDGREWVETTDKMWRKNRRGGACRGVDLNRNYEFLFTSGLSTSTAPCEYEVYRGPQPHSEREVQGILNLLDNNPAIRGVLDVHAFRGLVLYPWGDDYNQTTNPTMNFRNPAYDGQRGFKFDSYKEHIVDKDWQFYQQTAFRMRDRVKEVAGRSYIAQQVFDLYPTSATLNDYAYARHLVNNSRPKILGMAVEIGFQGDGEFRPLGAAAQTVRNEGVVLIVEFCLAMMCVGDALLSSAVAQPRMAGQLRAIRDELQESRAGRQYVGWLESLGGEVIARLADPGVLCDLPAVLKELQAWWQRTEEPLDEKAAQRASRLLHNLRKRGSAELKTAIDAALADVELMTGKPASATVTRIKARAPAAAASTRRPKTKRKR